jgi:hypothetical protein
MRGTLLALTLVAVPAAAWADTPAKIKPAPKTGPNVGLTETYRFTPAAGFVDDPIASDGTRVAFVVSDTAGTAVLHVINFDGTEVAKPIDLAPVTLKPTALAFAGKGVLVIGGEADAQLAALVNLDGKVVYKTPEVDRASIVTRGDKLQVALWRSEPSKIGTKYSVELRAADTGKKVGKVKAVEVDGTGTNAKLGFKISHWTTGFTRAVGIKDGTWNKVEDQRSPDVEATYDVTTGKFVSTAPIPDLLAQRKRFTVLEAAGGKDTFVRMKDDLGEIELWQDGQKTAVTLDQPIVAYGDPRKSLDYAPGPKGAWIALQVDPVNVEAVKRKIADLEYWDLYEVGDGGKATRRGRLFAGGQRLRFGWAGDRLWVLDRNVGFDRGGKSLAFYTMP